MADGSPTLYGKGRSAPEEVWGRVREDYLSGLPGIEVCRRHGVGLTAMRNRAAREGWRRTDQPWTPPNTLDPDDEGVLLEHEIDGDLDRVELRQLSFVAWRRMQRAVLRGQAAEALRWRRVQLVLDAEVVVEDQAMEQEQRRWQYLHGPAQSPVEVDRVD